MKRTASAVWSGNLKNGKGSVSTESGVLKTTPYSFTTRFEQNDAGTNPEELIAAAHAGCFTMALSVFLETAGFIANELETTAELHFDKVDNDWTVTEIALTLTADVPQLAQVQLEDIANEAKEKCPISRLLNTKISLTATLKT